MTTSLRRFPQQATGPDPELTEAVIRIAVSYVRQSAAKADRTEASPMTQRAANERESERWGTFGGHYEDIGISGWDPDAGREGFERMLRDARNGDFQVLIVYNVSRFSRREVMDAIPVVTELHRLGVTIVSVMEGVFAPRDNMALIYLIMRLDAAHQESQNKSVAVREVKAIQRAAGSWMGGAAPYGLRAEKELQGKLAIYKLRHEPEEAENLRRIWATIREHMGQPIKAGKKHPGSISGICTDMNQRGVPTRGRRTAKERTGSQWSSRTLSGILANPAIAGMSYETMYRSRPDGIQTKTVEGYRIHRDEEGRPLMICDPIISPAEWYELQEWLAGRGQGRGLTRGTSILAGLRTVEHDAVLTCECERPMTSMNTASKNPKAKPVYRCTRANAVPDKADEHEGGNAVMVVHLDDHVARRIFNLIQTAEGDDGALAVLNAATNTFAQSQENPAQVAERSAVVAERADAQRALDELYDDLDASVYAGKTGRERFLAKKAKIDARLGAVDVRLSEISTPKDVVLPLMQWLPADPEADPVGPGSWWYGAEMEEKRAFVSLFVERITVSKAATRWGHARRGSYDVGERVEIEFVKVKEQS
ncbi:recombinase family protein [Streptacidiphilus sp. P02-A3a]|uniref:recombinase family protein n=1 Tax=Streptacidiphilus sp. P02-A3a TaxID=2704468 RepID=UPI0015F7B32D|nr:recombinase family protein [Streptacidiphilus sp. P02-A3a]QMU67178.1 recombinase family protein [Streptacidiphilus sp. P02-A3a]